MKKLLILLLLVPSLSWGGITLTCQGYSMTQFNYKWNDIFDAKYYESPTVIINENTKAIYTGNWSYPFRYTLNYNGSDAFRGYSVVDEKTKSEIYINRYNGEMTVQVFEPNRSVMDSMSEFRSNCTNATQKF